MDGLGSTRRRRRHRRVQPAREARHRAAAPGPLRPPDLRLPARRRRPRGDPRGPHRGPSRSARTSTSSMIARQTVRPDRRRPGQRLQRGGDLRRPRAAAARSRRRTSTPRSSASSPACSRAARSTTTSAGSSPSTRPATRCVAELLPGVNRVHKISIVPRGKALGYTLNLPEEDRYLKTREELIDHMACCSAAASPRRSSSARSPPARPTTSTASPRSPARWSTSTRWAPRSRRCSVAAEGGAVSDRTRQLRDEEQQHLADEAMRIARDSSSASTATSSTRWRGALLQQRGPRAPGHRAHHGRRPAGRARRRPAACGSPRPWASCPSPPTTPSKAEAGLADGCRVKSRPRRRRNSTE